MTVAPALSRPIAILGVIPRPPAEFSPLTTTKLTPLSSRIRGIKEATALRPGSPTTSPRKSNRSILGCGCLSK